MRRLPNPDPRLVVLAKHGLVVWGDTAEEGFTGTIEVINQAVAFVNERTGHAPRFGGRHPATERVSDARAGAARWSCCPPCAAPSPASATSC